MQTNEFRVRPVTRFILTHHHDPAQPGKTPYTRTVGEFPNVECAEEVGVALQALVPGSTLETIPGRQAEYPPKVLAAAMAVRAEPDGQQYVIVQRGFDINTRAFYAESEPEALAMKAQAEKEYGLEYRIFSRPKA